MSKYKLVNVPEGIDLGYATVRFNDESISLDALTRDPYCFLCSPKVRSANRCNTDCDGCYRCMLSMRHYSSGAGIYQNTKRRLFAEYAGQSGYQITRPGFEHFNAKNPVNDVKRMKE